MPIKEKITLLSQRQHQLNKLMNLLRNMAQAYNIAVVITNQNQTDPKEWKNSSDKPVGGNIVAHSSAFRIKLYGSNSEKVYAKLVTSPCYPEKEIIFSINAGGITDVDEN